MWRILPLLLLVACSTSETPLSISAAESRGATLLLEGRAAEAAELFAQAMNQDPRSSVAAFGAAEAAALLGDDHKAGLLLEHGLALMPRTLEGLRFAGGALLYVAEHTRLPSRRRQRALVAWDYLSRASRPEVGGDFLLSGRAALLCGEARKAEAPLLASWRIAPSIESLRALDACWHALGVPDTLPKFLSAEQKAGVLTPVLAARIAAAQDLKPYLPPETPAR